MEAPVADIDKTVADHNAFAEKAAPLHERIAELRAALLAVILAYDDDNDAPDPEKALSDAIQAARATWRGDE